MAEKKPAGRIRKFVDKVRKKVAPTFGEQFDKARKEKKKTFRSTRDDKKKGKLEYSTMRKKEVSDKIAAGRRDDAKVQPNAPKKKGTYEKATGTKLSARGKAFRDAFLAPWISKPVVFPLTAFLIFLEVLPDNSGILFVLLFCPLS